MQVLKFRNKLVAGLFGAAVTAAVPAAAQQMDWSGAYWGVVAGAVDGSNAWSERTVMVSNAAGDFSGNGFGVTLGFNGGGRQNLVWGIELDASKMNADATSDTGNGFMCPADGCTTSITRLATLRGRVGLSVGDWLPYLTAGAAAGEVEGTTSIGEHGSDTLVGLTVGLGVERAFTPRMSGRIEVLHTDLGRLELPVACSSRCFTDIEFTTVRLGVNFHF